MVELMRQTQSCVFFPDTSVCLSRCLCLAGVQISGVVGEQELGLRQMLRTMGMLDSAYWLSWMLFEVTPPPVYHTTRRLGNCGPTLAAAAADGASPVKCLATAVQHLHDHLHDHGCF